MGLVMTSREIQERSAHAKCGDDGASSCSQAIIKPVRYYLNPPFEDVYLTAREAECVYYYTLGFTLIDIAHKLKISHRTTEYYIANVKKKLRVRSKQELLSVLQQARFNYNKKD